MRSPLSFLKFALALRNKKPEGRSISALRDDITTALPPKIDFFKSAYVAYHHTLRAVTGATRRLLLTKILSRSFALVSPFVAARRIAFHLSQLSLPFDIGSTILTHRFVYEIVYILPLFA